MRPKAMVAWSSGKDSAYALHVARTAGELDIVGLLTTITADYERVSMHGVREALLDRQIDAIGLPCYKVKIPAPCPNEVYERAMSEALDQLRADEISHVVFGDLFLEDIRAYRETQMSRVNMECVFPLWLKDTRTLAHEMIDSGLRATLACVDPKQLDPRFAGRTYDEELIAELPEGVDPCGENGEFHTVVTAGPMFRHSIAAQVGEVVERDGFVFADVIPSQDDAQQDASQQDSPQAGQLPGVE